MLIGFVSTLVYLSQTLILSPKLKEQKEQKEFFERVNDVELEYLASGKRIDSLKIVAV